MCLNNKYLIEDSLGNIIKSFNTYKQAYTFIIMSQRYDWKLIHPKQC